MDLKNHENVWKEKEARRKSIFPGKSPRISRDLMHRLEYRATPYFQFDLQKISQNIAAITSALQLDHLFYAVKSNSLSRVLKRIGSSGCGFEINNKNEYMGLEGCGLTNRPMINSSPIASGADVRFLAGMGVQAFCLDAREQADNLSINAPGADVYVRLYHGNQGSRFKLNRLGADLSMAMDLITYARKKGLNPVGVTFHVGSQCCEPQSWKEAVKKASMLFEAFPFLTILNLGGGFPVRYGRDVPSLGQIARVINQSLDLYFQRRPRLYAEPGRFIVGDAAFSCASVIQVREQMPVSRAVIDLSVFSGFIEILEISDGFHYAFRTRGTDHDQWRRYHIGGPTCAGTDMICKDVMLPRLHVDYQHPQRSSRLYFANTGAYTLDYIARHQRSGFNGSRIPKIYFSEGEGHYDMAV